MFLLGRMAALGILLSCTAMGCSGSEVQSNRSGGDAETSKETDDFERTVPPTHITGVNLAIDCRALSSDQQSGTYELGCNLLADGKVIDPARVSPRVDWKYSGNERLTDVTIDKSPAVKKVQVIYMFGKKSYVAISELSKIELEFHYEEPRSKQNLVIKSRIESILAGMANQTNFRLVMSSIRVQDPDLPVKFIDRIEIKVDGQWYILGLEAGTFPHGENNRLEIQTNATLNDHLMFQSVFGFLDADAALSPDQLTRFANQAPYDAVTEPLFMQYGFDRPVSVTGIRYNGGEALENKNLPTGFPDKVHFEVSSDKNNWHIVPGSSIDIEREFENDILEFYWNGADFSDLVNKPENQPQ